MKPFTITILDTQSVHIQQHENFVFTCDNITTDEDVVFTTRENLQCNYEEDSKEYKILKKRLSSLGEAVLRTIAWDEYIKELTK